MPTIMINPNKIAVSDFSQFLLSDVAFYLLQQTKYIFSNLTEVK